MSNPTLDVRDRDTALELLLTREGRTARVPMVWDDEVFTCGGEMYGAWWVVVDRKVVSRAFEQIGLEVKGAECDFLNELVTFLSIDGDLTGTGMVDEDEDAYEWQIIEKNATNAS